MAAAPVLMGFWIDEKEEKNGPAGAGGMTVAFR